MTCMRVVLVFGMLCTVIAAAASPRGHDGARPFGRRDKGKDAAGAPLFRFAGIATLLPTVVYSQVFHAGVPILAQPVRAGVKAKLPRVFAAAVSVTGLTYVTLGLALALYFGPAVLASCNINWDDYYNTAHGTPGAGPS